MKRRSLALALGLALLTCAPLRAATVTVNVQNFTFSPNPVNIDPGDTVHWVWVSGFHSTTSDTGVWDSTAMNTPFSFDFTFPTGGAFPYHCSIHGASGGVGMSSIVNVSPVELQAFDAE